MEIMLKIWLTVLVLLIPAHVIVDFADEKCSARTQDIVRAFFGALSGILIGLFFAIIITQIWSW